MPEMRSLWYFVVTFSSDPLLFKAEPENAKDGILESLMNLPKL